jgi:hypothetical protein
LRTAHRKSFGVILIGGSVVRRKFVTDPDPQFVAVNVHGVVGMMLVGKVGTSVFSR